METANSLVQLVRKPEGLSLTVPAPEKGQEDISYPELVAYLEGLGLPSIDFSAVKQAYKRERGKPLIIGPGDFGAFKVELSPDEMSAYLILYDSRGEPSEALRPQIIKALEDKGVSFGLKQDVLGEVLAQGVAFKRVCVAEGRQPVEGSDATVHHPSVPPELELPDGGQLEAMRVWSDPFIVVVEPDTVIAEKRLEGTEGQEGMTVTGRPVPALPGADLVLHGAGAEVSADGKVLKATQRGQLRVHPEGASVGPLREIEGDLEGVGQAVKFEGSVLVKGAVGDGAIIQAGGDVEILGPVSGATIVAGRNVVLRSEVKGMGETSIRAGGNIAAISVEEADIAARDSLYVMEELIDCRLGARRRVLMGPQSRLAGGTVVAGEMLQVTYLGRPDGPRTQIKVATPDLLLKWQELIKERHARELKPLKEKIAKLRGGIDALERRKVRRGGKLTPQNEQLLQKMQRDVEETSRLCREIEERMKKLPGREHLAKAGRICGLETLYPNVVINLGTMNFSPRDEEETERLVEGPDGITVEWIESCLAAF